ncbi:hypothetical protein ACMHYB_22000 [Sorangium sp. So ce1128]
MSHFVFVETTRPGIQALEQAKRLGHAVTRLTSHKFDWLLRPEDHAALKQLGCDTVEIDDSQNASSVEAGLRRCLQEGPVDAVLSVLHQCAAPASLAAGLLGLRASSAQGVLNARDINNLSMHRMGRLNEAACGLSFPVSVHRSSAKADYGARQLQQLRK